MKVILRENVEHLGQIGDVVKVAPGYASRIVAMSFCEPRSW